MSENNFHPSVALMSLNHQWENLALKSPVIIDKDGLRLLISFNSFWKLIKNESNS